MDTFSQKTITLFFQSVMFIIGIWIFILALNLINQSGVIGATPSPPMDSTVTVSNSRDSSMTEVIASSNETKKEYSTKDKCNECLTGLYDTSYSYFLLGTGIIAVAFFLPRIQNIVLKDINISVKEELEQVKEQLNEIETKSVEVGGKESSNPNPTEFKKKVFESIKERPSKNLEDTQKGRWGGLNKTKGRALTAEVKSISNDLYQVHLLVRSTNKNKPLTGLVKFNLHDTFNNSKPVIAVKDGVAELKLIAWGAFTVGAEADKGETKLELDLSELESAPPKFRAL